jgi:hypothetical protein
MVVFSVYGGLFFNHNVEGGAGPSHWNKPYKLIFFAERKTPSLGGSLLRPKRKAAQNEQAVEVLNSLHPRSRHPQSRTSYTGRVETGRMIAGAGRVPFAISLYLLRILDIWN